jgi:hypothetical protein
MTATELMLCRYYVLQHLTFHSGNIAVRGENKNVIAYFLLLGGEFMLHLIRIKSLELEHTDTSAYDGIEN